MDAGASRSFDLPFLPCKSYEVFGALAIVYMHFSGTLSSHFVHILRVIYVIIWCLIQRMFFDLFGVMAHPVSELSNQILFRL